MVKENKVFQFVLFYNSATEAPQIIDSGFVIAESQDKARLIAGRKLSYKWDDKINDVEVLVRPF